MVRGIVNNRVGKRYDALLVIARNGSDANNNALWTCKCDCGNIVDIRANLLDRGQRFCSKQCPKYQRHARVDITGRRFGRLIALRHLRIGAGGKSIWQFQCDCGKDCETTADRVIQKITRSCGCLEIESRIKHGKSNTREYHREAHRKWAKANPHLAIANANKRREDFRKRIPKWLTEEHWKQIRAFYTEAALLTKKTGIVHVVDHIHPLRGKIVSGLHVPWNLQVLTQSDNAKKSATFIDDVC